MPKAPRRRLTVAHDPPLRPYIPAQRDFAVPESQVEKVEVGSLAGLPAGDVLKQISETSSSLDVPLTKKSRILAKHSSLLSKLTRTASRAPYALPSHPVSKSHARRLKRKVRDAIPLEGLNEAIEEVKEEVEEDQAQQRRKGLIGEAPKGAFLTAKQRKRTLETERTQLKAVLSDPTFRANPFAAIRAHAANSLDMTSTEAATQ